MLLSEINGILVHELTHAWSWYDRLLSFTDTTDDENKYTQKACNGFIEGIADVISKRIKF